MPLLKHPHMVTELRVDVTYCDGAHAEGEGVTHPCLSSMTVFTIVPPGDDHDQLHWPPSSPEAIEKLIERTAHAILMGLSGGMLNIPGCQPVELEVQDGSD